jgi:hypothetical protein
MLLEAFHWDLAIDCLLLKITVIIGLKPLLLNENTKSLVSLLPLRILQKICKTRHNISNCLEYRCRKVVADL